MIHDYHIGGMNKNTDLNRSLGLGLYISHNGLKKKK